LAWICRECAIATKMSLAKLTDRKTLALRHREAAVASFLSSGGRREAAFARQLDRLSRQLQQLERNLCFTAEILTLVNRTRLTSTLPLPEEAQAAGQSKV